MEKNVNNPPKSDGALFDYIEIINQFKQDNHAKLHAQYNIDLPSAPIDCERIQMINGELTIDGWNLRFLENIVVGTYCNNETHDDEIVVEIGWVDDNLSILNWSINEYY